MGHRLFLSAAALLLLASNASACSDGPWIQEVSTNGTIITLEDGSIWKVDPVDAYISSLWLPTTEITACDDKLINTDDDEVVSVTRIQ
jgi:hypothetical protein